MGWTFYHATNYKNGKVDRKAECDKLFNNASCKLLKSTMRGTTYYCALETPTGEVTAYVVLTAGHDLQDPYCNFGYKYISETCGPYKYDCPKNILNLLTPTTNTYANEWRQKCRENKKTKSWLTELPIGGKIEWTDFHRNTHILTKHAPAGQFKKWFWFNAASNTYVSKKYVTEARSKKID